MMPDIVIEIVLLLLLFFLLGCVLGCIARRKWGRSTIAEPVRRGAARHEEAAETSGSGRSPKETEQPNAADKAASAQEATKPKAGQKTQTGGGDDLKKIKGIGPVLEKKLNTLDIYRYEQIAAWTSDDVARVDEAVGGRGRISREDWIGQAQRLSAQGS